MTCPSEWEGKSECGKNVRIHYRTGRISIYLDDVLKETTEKDDLDVGSYMDDEELIEILKRDKLVLDSE